MFVKMKKVIEMTCLSKATLWRLEKKGDFPAKRNISEGRIGWVLSEVLEWIESRPKANNGGAENGK